MFFVLVLHILDAAATRSEHDVRARECLLVAFCLKHFERRKLLSEEGAGFGLQRGQRHTRPDAADDVGPLDFGIVQIGRADDRVHRLKRQVIFGRLAGKTVAVKALRRDTHDGDGLGVDPKGAESVIAQTWPSPKSRSPGCKRDAARAPATEWSRPRKEFVWPSSYPTP